MAPPNAIAERLKNRMVALRALTETATLKSRSGRRAEVGTPRLSLRPALTLRIS